MLKQSDILYFIISERVFYHLVPQNILRSYIYSFG